MSFYRTHPDENGPYFGCPEDDDESIICRFCRGVIPAGEQVEWNGWDWCAEHVPAHVTAGREQERRADERRGK